MPIFDVTITRTGCVMVEADNANEAMHIAANLPTEDVSWTDSWEASDANEIAANAEEFGEDMKLVHTDPFIKVRILASDNGFHCGEPFDGKICIFAAHDTPAERKAVTITQALFDANFIPSVSFVKVEDENTLVYNDEKFTPAALCNRLNAAPYKVHCLPGATVLTVSLPANKTAETRDVYQTVSEILEKHKYMHEKTEEGTIEVTPCCRHKSDSPKVIEELKALGCSVLQDPQGGLIICVPNK